MKKFLNTCIDCKTVSDKGIWEITLANGPMMVKERFNVVPELGLEPEHFDLDIIDAKTLASKYNMEEEAVEEAILDGTVLCPECQSKKYFEYSEALDSQYLK